MADGPEASISSATDLLATGRRHLAVRDYNAAAEALAKACEILAKEHGDTADECAEAYLWYGKALLGLSREESGVLGDGVPGTGNADEDDEDDEDQDEIADDEQNGEIETEAEAKPEKENESSTHIEVKKIEAESTTKEDEPSSSVSTNQPVSTGTSNGDALDESVANLENEDDVDNLQLAWEMLELSRGILQRREGGGGGALADALLALGEVALESETYDKAVLDMMSCLEIQKELYPTDDRRIAETHYQIGLANSLASNFEDAITHFKNAANILEKRIKSLEYIGATEDTTVKKYVSSDPSYSIESEVKELKELLPEIHEKIQDMMDYKAETMKRVRETLRQSGAGAPSCAAPTPAAPTPAAPSDISHLVRRKRKASGDSAPTAPSASGAKRPHT